MKGQQAVQGSSVKSFLSAESRILAIQGSSACSFILKSRSKHKASSEKKINKTYKQISHGLGQYRSQLKKDTDQKDSLTPNCLVISSWDKSLNTTTYKTESHCRYHLDVNISMKKMRQGRKRLVKQCKVIYQLNSTGQSSYSFISI